MLQNFSKMFKRAGGSAVLTPPTDLTVKPMKEAKTSSEGVYYPFHEKANTAAFPIGFKSNGLLMSVPLGAHVTLPEADVTGAILSFMRSVVGGDGLLILINPLSEAVSLWSERATLSLSSNAEIGGMLNYLAYLSRNSEYNLRTMVVIEGVEKLGNTHSLEVREALEEFLKAADNDAWTTVICVGSFPKHLPFSPMQPAVSFRFIESDLKYWASIQGDEKPATWFADFPEFQLEFLLRKFFTSEIATDMALFNKGENLIGYADVSLLSDYAHVLTTDSQIREVANQTFDVREFLIKVDAFINPASPPVTPVVELEDSFDSIIEDYHTADAPLSTAIPPTPKIPDSVFPTTLPHPIDSVNESDEQNEDADNSETIGDNLGITVPNNIASFTEDDEDEEEAAPVVYEPMSEDELDAAIYTQLKSGLWGEILRKAGTSQTDFPAAMERALTDFYEEYLPAEVTGLQKEKRGRGRPKKDEGEVGVVKIVTPKPVPEKVVVEEVEDAEEETVVEEVVAVKEKPTKKKEGLITSEDDLRKLFE